MLLWQSAIIAAHLEDKVLELDPTTAFHMSNFFPWLECQNLTAYRRWETRILIGGGNHGGWVLQDKSHVPKMHVIVS